MSSSVENLCFDQETNDPSGVTSNRGFILHRRLLADVNPVIAAEIFERTRLMMAMGTNFQATGEAKKGA